MANKRSFPFLKDFRQKRGYDFSFNLLKNKEKLDELEDFAGVYIIEAADHTKFSCPLGNSSIIYIGKSDHIKRRLKEHLSRLLFLEKDEDYGIYDDNQGWLSSRYQFMHYCGAKVYVYKCLGKQDAKNLEAELLWHYYVKYRSLPIGNGAKSYRKD